jgi:glycosyltransferase involved in cell wall biosynthesis
VDSAAEHPSTVKNLPRVCFALSTRGFVQGGLETMGDNLAAGLARRGYPVAFVLGVAPGRPGRLDRPPVARVVGVPVLAHDAPAARAMARLLRLPPLHVQSLSFVAACLAHPRARRLLLSADVGVTFLEAEAVLVSRLLRRRRAASIAYLAGAIHLGWARADRSTRRLATSRVVADLYRRHGLACDAVLTPGVSADLLDGPPARSASMPGPRLLYVGRLEPNKRVDWLLSVLPRLRLRLPGLELNLRLVGDGPSRRHLEHMVRAAGLHSQVDFAGAVAPEQVRRELRQADVFVFPSAYESFGTVALEALAAGLPVVASDLPALREATGGHASLVALDDLDAWVDAIARLLTNQALRAARVQAGRQWAAGFTWDRVLDQFEPVVRAAAHVQVQG